MKDKTQAQQNELATRRAIGKYTSKTWGISLIVSVLITYPFRGLFKDKTGESYVVLPAVVTITILTLTIMALLRFWLRKKPSDSGWRIWFD